MKLVFQCCFRVYTWLVAIPLVGVFTVVFGALAIALSYVLPERASSKIGCYWARCIAAVAFMSPTIHNRDVFDSGQSYVIVANHQSAMDIILVYGWLGVDFRWVMKQEVRKIPVMGYACYRIGHVFINRRSTSSALKSLEAAKQKICNGTSVFFFPEGTRSNSSDLLPFKRGAFKMALDLQLPILPVTLIDMNRSLPNRTINLQPANVGMQFHAPIPAAGLSEDDLPELIEQTMQSIRAPLKENTP